MQYRKGQLVRLKPLDSEMRQTLIELYDDVDIPEGLTTVMQADMNEERVLIIIDVRERNYRLSDGNLWRDECFTAIKRYSLEYI